MPRKKATTKPRKPLRMFTCDTITIPASVFGKLIYTWCKGDWWQAGLALYRLKSRNPTNPITYLQKGQSLGWIWEPVQDETTQPERVKAWIEEHVFRHKPERQESRVLRTSQAEATAIGDILDGIMHKAGGLG